MPAPEPGGSEVVGAGPPVESGGAGGPGGVIHDIGFRHYAGARLGARDISWALFVDSLRGAYGLGRSTRSKVMPMLLLAGICLPALIMAVITNVTGADRLPLAYNEYTLTVSILITLYVAGQAPASVSRDLRFRVVTLYFSRPLSRGSYVRAKFAALAAAVFVLLALPQLILYAGAVLGKLPFWAQTRGVLVALAGALLLAPVLAGVSLVIAAVTPRRGLGVAAVIAVLVMCGGVGAALQELGRQQGSSTLQGYSGLLSPDTLVNGVLVWAFGAARGGGATPPGTVGGLVFLAVTVALAAACYGFLIVRYRRVSVS